MQSTPFNPMTHAATVSTIQQRRLPFSNLSFNPNGAGCRQAEHGPTLGPYYIPPHRAYLPWTANAQIASGEFLKSASSAFTRYPRAMAAAAMAVVAATSEKRSSPDEIKSESLDLSTSSTNTCFQQTSHTDDKEVKDSIKQENLIEKMEVEKLDKFPQAFVSELSLP